MLRTNSEKVVMMSVQGTVSAPAYRGNFGIDSNGVPFTVPGTGGIVYNIKIGDSVYGWESDHIEPGVSSIREQKDSYNPKNRGYHFYACIGNTAKIITGDLKGKTGIVTGHHGGAEHIMIDFPHDVLEELTLDDKFLIKGWGQGLKLLDYPDVHAYNLDPDLLQKMNITEKDGKIQVPVSAIVPGELMGSGVGSLSMGTGDYDIMTTDKEYLKKHNLMDLRFGDFVAIINHDNVYGRSWREGAVTIGIVIHGDCKYAGHGPGVTTLLSSMTPIIEPVIDENANIGKVLGIGKFRK